MQIHCFDAATLETVYTILTNPIVMGCTGPGGVGYGPLAVGPRWLAYSGSPVIASNSGRVSPQHLTPSASFPGFSSNGNLVAHYAKESSKHLAAGIVTLGDMGYKKLSRYCSELLPDSYSSLQSGSPGLKGNGTVNGHLADADNIGMVLTNLPKHFFWELTFGFSVKVSLILSKATLHIGQNYVCFPALSHLPKGVDHNS